MKADTDRIVRLPHARVVLALHRLRDGEGRALLLLHGLGERSPDVVPEELASWPGPVVALDLTGHGASTVPQGGGYTAEVLIGDADTALTHLGEATLCGRGLGGWIALLLAGARPEKVRGAIVCDGPGLTGGSSRPGSTSIAWVDPQAAGPPDPYALVELSRDVRPPEYATAFVRQAAVLSGLARPIWVCAREPAPWLQAVLEEPGVERGTIEEALAACASA